MMVILKRQRGVTLVIVLIMLVVLTLLVISAVNTSTTTLKIINHTQSVEVNESIAIDAIQNVVSTVDPFKTGLPATQYIERDSNGKVVLTTSKDSSKAIGELLPPACVWSAPADGFSATDPLAPEDDVWDIQAVVWNKGEEKNKSTTVEIHQGVSIRMLAGSCK